MEWGELPKTRLYGNDGLRGEWRGKMRQGFFSGSDDYMVKPVNVNEMVLRVGALLRRAQILNEHKIVIGSTEFDYDAMTVTTDKESLVLPKKQFLLLYKLAASPGRTFTKQQLMDEVWGYEPAASFAV